MKMQNDCLPCIARGSLDAARLATDDEALQREVVKAVLKELISCDMNYPPPLMALYIGRTVREITGVADPYARLKKKYNDFALSLFPALEKKAMASSFDTALRFCIAGNIIDFGTHARVGRQKVLDTIDQALAMDINGDGIAFEKACKKADKILWIADNAGEIVFDRLLLQKLDCRKIIYAVRGGPAQNDATLEDAEYAGLTGMVEVTDTGAAIPGVILDHCSEDFKGIYTGADLIISKGQGNFETLDLSDSRIFFLFKAKCRVVADHAGCSLDDMVIKNFNKSPVG
ncbi:MAG: ARMT1-like domain-containing protein [Desulfobacula sp.]|nr:ARMT1-like domain-containing protein [Desulfobacula sp.]